MSRECRREPWAHRFAHPRSNAARVAPPIRGTAGVGAFDVDESESRARVGGAAGVPFELEGDLALVDERSFRIDPVRMSRANRSTKRVRHGTATAGPVPGPPTSKPRTVA
jgi:hypothetical protein